MPENLLLTPEHIFETLPKFEKFIQAAKPGELKDMNLSDAVLEPKYDGHRLTAYVGEYNGESHAVRLFARSGAEKGHLLPHICNELMFLPAGTWVDGEAVGDGDTWNTVQSVLGADTYREDLAESISYVVFDMIAFDGFDMRSMMLKDRRSFGMSVFNTLLPGGSGRGYAAWGPQYEPSQEIYDALLAQGYEGAIVKDVTKPYASGKRGHGWFKLKQTHTMDVVVLGAKAGKGKFQGMIGALIFGQRLPGHDVFTVPEKEIVWYDGHRYAIRGAASGMTDEERWNFTRMWLDVKPWKPLLGTVIEIAHMGADLSEAGKVRHPQFKRIRTDKSPEACSWHDK